jgi:periplasmic divalent cation tolerance protein
MDACLQVSTTAGSHEEAERLAAAALEARLAACVQIVGPVQSRYWWNGSLEHAEEWILVLKTRADRFQPLSRALREAHSYDVPEITAIPIAEGTDDYLRWVQEESAPSQA